MEQIELVNFAKVLNDFSIELQREYTNELIYKDKLSSRNLLESVEVVTIEKDNTHYQVIFRALDYWKYIEEGSVYTTKKPPFQAILNWVRMKPIIPTPNNKGYVPTEKGLAYIIREHIFKHGIKPQPILETTVGALFDEYKPLFIEAIKKDMTKKITLTIESEKINKKLKLKN